MHDKLSHCNKLTTKFNSQDCYFVEFDVIEKQVACFPVTELANSWWKLTSQLIHQYFKLGNKTSERRQYASIKKIFKSFINTVFLTKAQPIVHKNKRQLVSEPSYVTSANDIMSNNLKTISLRQHTVWNFAIMHIDFLTAAAAEVEDHVLRKLEPLFKLALPASILRLVTELCCLSPKPPNNSQM